MKSIFGNKNFCPIGNIAIAMQPGQLDQCFIGSVAVANNTFPSPIFLTNLSASLTCSGIENKFEQWASLPVCSCTCLTHSGWLCPRLVTAMPEVKSKYRSVLIPKLCALTLTTSIAGGA